MTIDWTHFTPLASLAGAAAIGMTDPAKGFVDLAGPRDPSLALVMVGAIAVGLHASALAHRRQPAWSGAAGLFVLAMLAGMLLHDNVRARWRRKVAPA